MPSSITHELIAMEGAELLSSAAREAAFCAPDYYILGAQGPDLFFFYRPLSKREENFGRMLHRDKIYEWFSALLSSLSAFTGHDFERCLAYALGFCSHLAADVAFHPFVYRYLEETGAPKRTHQLIENDWDVYFLRQLRGGSVLRYAFPFDLAEIAEDGVLFRYLSACANAVGRTLAPAPFRRMLNYFDLYLTHFHKKHGRVLRAFGLSAFYPRETPEPNHLFGEDFLRRSGGMGRSAEELFLSAAQSSATCISAFLDAFNAGMPLPHELFSRHLLTGEPL